MWHTVIRYRVGFHKDNLILKEFLAQLNSFFPIPHIYLFFFSSLVDTQKHTHVNDFLYLYITIVQIRENLKLFYCTVCVVYFDDFQLHLHTCLWHHPIFPGWIKSPLFIDCAFFIYRFIDRLLGWIHKLVIINTASLNINVQVSLSLST